MLACDKSARAPIAIKLLTSPVSNHHGNGNPDLTGGFDRTFGPVRLALLWHRSGVLKSDHSPTTTSTKPPRALQSRVCVSMPENSPTPPGTHHFMIPLPNSSQVTSRPLAVALGPVKSRSQQESPTLSPSLLAMALTSKITILTQSHISTGVMLGLMALLRCLASRLERIA